MDAFAFLLLAGHARDTPILHWAGNYIADALAGDAAKSEGLFHQQYTEQILSNSSLATNILTRPIAVALEVTPSTVLGHDPTSFMPKETKLQSSVPYCSPRLQGTPWMKLVAGVFCVGFLLIPLGLMLTLRASWP